MALYRCTLADRSGERREVLREALSADEAAAACSGADSFILAVQAVDGSSRGRSGSFPAAVILEFTEMMGLLLEAGVSLKDALEVASSITPRGRLRDLVTQLLESVKKGDAFSRAVDEQGESFPPLYRGMVRIGERIGSVESVIPQLAAYLRERKMIRDKIAGALAYPLLVLVVVILGTIGIVVFLLPRMQELFAALGGAAALAMKARVATMTALSRGAVLGVVAAALASAAIAALRRGGGRSALAIDRFLLRAPGLKNLFVPYEAQSFAFAMEALTRGGIPLELALSEAAAIAGNAAFRAAVLGAREAVLKGETLSSAFRSRKEFPEYIALWIALGEKSGQVERVFAQIGRYFRADIDRRSSRFMALVEPALILLVGGMVLLLVIFFIVPLFTMYGSVL